MSDRPYLRMSRRGFVAAMGASAFAAAMSGRAAPLLSPRTDRPMEAVNSWLEVDLDVFERNLGFVQGMASGGASCCAIMKADG